MKTLNSAIVVGWINSGKPADCGETMKNQLLVKRLEELGVHCYLVDFKNWKRHPWVFLYLLYLLLFNKKSTLVFSTSASNIYNLMKLLKKIKWKQNIIHWVIGGLFADRVKQGFFDKSVVGYCDHTIVESETMVQTLRECGVKGVIQKPNFKPVLYYPSIKERLTSINKRRLKFVFLSRIMPEKGCDYIFEAVKNLNTGGFSDSYVVDFYGKIAPSYEDEFIKKISENYNVAYKGFLNLRINDGYDKLAEYDVMLFPTYWKGEGFAGVFIDSMISGVPIIATDWAHNKQFLKDGETAMFIPVHNSVALAEKMKYCIDNKNILVTLAENCQQIASIYDVKNVITEDLLKQLNIL